MMLDRMFLAEEQQSLIKLRQELEESSNKAVEVTQQTATNQVDARQTRTPSPSSGSLQMAPPQTVQVTQPQKQIGRTPSTPSSLSSQVEHPSEEYDEWACIQRELGCLTSDESKPTSISAPKRSASSDSRLESLKKFRVDKHQKKNTEVPQNYVQVSAAQNRTQLHHHNVTAQTTNTQFIHSSQMATHHNVHFSHSTQHIVQHFTHTVHHNVHSSSGSNTGQSVYNASVHNYQGDATDEDNTQNNSIDEQVQSAIDSILNLQQNTNIDLDDAVSSILS